jgi:hypothetical protein
VRGRLLHRSARKPLGFNQLALGNDGVAVLFEGMASRDVTKIMSKPEEVQQMLARDHESEFPIAYRVGSPLRPDASALCGTFTLDAIPEIEHEKCRIPRMTTKACSIRRGC